jgi:hypothetical protein
VADAVAGEAPKSKGKDKGKGKGKDAGAGVGVNADVDMLNELDADVGVDAEGLQELANAVMVRGAATAAQAEDDADAQALAGLAGLEGARLDIAQRVQGIDSAGESEGVLDPRLAEMDGDSFDVQALWDSTRIPRAPVSAAAAAAATAPATAPAEAADSSSFDAPGELSANPDEAFPDGPPPPPPTRGKKGKGKNASATDPDRLPKRRDVGPSVPGPPPRVPKHLQAAAAAAAAGEGAGADGSNANTNADALANAHANAFAAPKRKRKDGNEASGFRDDELIEQFKRPGEMEAFIADRWLPSQELIRLEKAGSELWLVRVAGVGV